MDGYIAQQALAGRLFIGSTLYSGVVIPAYNATGQKFGVWNPAGSGVDLILDKLTMSLATIGTEALAGFGLSYLSNVGSSIGTGSPISAFTATTALNAKIVEGPASAAKFTLSATTSAPTHFYDIGIGLVSTDLNTATGESFDTMMHEFAGRVIIPPGVYVGLGASAAQGQTIRATLTWVENPRS